MGFRLSLIARGERCDEREKFTSDFSCFILGNLYASRSSSKHIVIRIIPTGSMWLRTSASEVRLELTTRASNINEKTKIPLRMDTIATAWTAAFAEVSNSLPTKLLIYPYFAGE